MKTLFDFITHVKGVEYLLAIGFIGLFILIWQALSPRPFASMLAAGRDDLDYMTNAGPRAAMLSVKHAAETPFLVAAYIAMVPIAFVAGLAMRARNGLYRFAGRR